MGPAVCVSMPIRGGAGKVQGIPFFLPILAQVHHDEGGGKGHFLGKGVHVDPAPQRVEQGTVSIKRIIAEVEEPVGLGGS